MDLGQYTYLAFNLIIISSILVAKILYRKTILPAISDFKKIFPVLIFFIIWDIIVTDKWWIFNQNYILFDKNFLKIPFEEILFFFSVPFGLITFTKNIKEIFENKTIIISQNLQNKILLYIRITFCLLFFLALIKQLHYTALVSFLLFIILNKKIIFNKIYLSGIIFTIVSTLIFNYYLTYLPIVIYNPIYKTNINILTIPIEDFAYGVILYIMMMKSLYERHQK